MSSKDNLLIKSARFVMSNTDYEKCPPPHRAEFAFIGRSNVGKSSLINSITSTKGLAKTSQVPGKTQLINHFLINDHWFLVDLPGYGYAKVSKDLRKKFEKMIFDYLLKRQNLVCLFILVDIRHKPQPIDIEFMNQMGEAQIPFYLVFTKADKLSNKQIQESVEAYKSILLESWEELPEMFITSAEKNLGKDEILQAIADLIKSSPYK